MEARKIFNPLQAIAQAATAADESEPAEMKSTSSVQNIKVGICPKCDEDMTRAVIANDETVFYCEGCRVSTPLPDEMIVPLV